MRLACRLSLPACAVLLVVTPAWAEDPPAQPPGAAPAPGAAPSPGTAPATPPPPDEEPELTGEAKSKHEAEVQKLYKELETEKNNQVVKGRIEQHGAAGSRAARDAVIKYCTGNKNHEFTSYGFKALARMGGKKSIAFLSGKHALRSDSFLLQQSAAEALAETKDARAAAALLDVLNDKTTKIEVIGACAIAAAKAAPSDERVIETLFGLAENKKDTIRAYVMEALGHLASDRALTRLTLALQTDKNTRVRESAAKGMGNSKRADAIPLLEKAVAEDKSLTVKSAAQTAITTIQGGR